MSHEQALNASVDLRIVEQVCDALDSQLAGVDDPYLLALLRWTYAQGYSDATESMRAGRCPTLKTIRED